MPDVGGPVLGDGKARLLLLAAGVTSTLFVICWSRHHFLPQFGPSRFGVSFDDGCDEAMRVDFLV